MERPGTPIIEGITSSGPYHGSKGTVRITKSTWAIQISRSIADGEKQLPKQIRRDLLLFVGLTHEKVA
jgi:hypothetical protein